ncbi:MAG: helix-turn-helix domain-containing protein [Clostridia bacterium]|nr:helix-turn-helix domain-containing protein [Clostridia bacterium]
MITLDAIKTKLQEEIKNSELSQSEIARRLGISNQTVSCYSLGTKLPSLDTFANLCKVLDVDPAEILCLNE